ncbi:hypothetical protein IAD21_00505 [Abditibacteriota bacterium]|nr:hypothetical protein IAD21_00505 [Abditibacteriota bacterium]
MGVILQNERQYEFTKSQLEKLEAAYQEAKDRRDEQGDVADIGKNAQLNSLMFLMDDLRAQMADYEKLRAGQVKSLTLDEVLVELPAMLVRARIARGLTHKQLAQALGTSEQQVQKDEAGGYSKASLEKLRRVSDELGVLLSGKAKLSTSNAVKGKAKGSISPGARANRAARRDSLAALRHE